MLASVQSKMRQMLTHRRSIWQFCRPRAAFSLRHSTTNTASRTGWCYVALPFARGQHSRELRKTRRLCVGKTGHSGSRVVHSRFMTYEPRVLPFIIEFRPNTRPASPVESTGGPPITSHAVRRPSSDGRLLSPESFSTTSAHDAMFPKLHRSSLSHPFRGYNLGCPSLHLANAHVCSLYR